MKLSQLLAAVAGVCVAGLQARGADAPQPPVAPDGAVKISLVATDPEVVTPIGATVDAKGRLFVIESNTHERQKTYNGPATDRILMFNEAIEAGKPGHVSTFFEGEKLMMNVVADPDGSIIVSARYEIFRLIDAAGQSALPRKVSLARLETKSVYPHNGLHGLAIDREGNIYFGLGENFGGDWTITGTDGGKLTGGDGAGSIFRMNSKGEKLTRIARGFWNPFGLGVDPLGQLWAVDNDPDGRPPCRLIPVAQGADYGFEWRYGRTGLHPLQCWDGEIPGTLGMVAGVGEAPVAVTWNRGRLFVSSWRDHVVQAFTLIPHGASYTANVQTLVSGGEPFRPTGMSFAPDGSLYVNDWASASYPVNGKGHIWKLTFTTPPPADADLKPTEAYLRAAKLRKSEDVKELVAAMDDADPATAQAAQFGLSQLPAIEKIEWSSLPTSGQKIGFLAAMLWRGASTKPFIADALSDSDDRVRQIGVRCVTEQQITEAKDGLKKLLESQVLSPRLLGMTIAAINQLDGDKAAKIDSGKIDGVLLARMRSDNATDQTKATALHMLQHSHPAIPVDQLAAMAHSSLQSLQFEAVRYLNGDTDKARFGALAQIASDEKLDAALRAEAIDGLSDDAAAQVDLLLKGAQSEPAIIRQESIRSIRPAMSSLTKEQSESVAQVAAKYPADADLVHRVMAQPLPSRPPESDTAAWQKVLEKAPGDPEAGRRLFFHSAGPACAKCHTVDGRGKQIGPDLTMIGHSQTREHVLESILDPSKEIAPLFMQWSIKTKSGKQVDGMLLFRRDGQQNEVYVDASGQETVVKESDVIDRRMRRESLMPTGLVQGMTDQELRDIVAFLMEKR